MPQKAAQFNINEVNETLILGQVTENVSGVLLDAEMGPIGKADILITNDTQFRKIYGRIRSDGSNEASYTNAVRALQRGSALRVVNVKHYDDVTDDESLTATKAEPGPINTHTLSAPLEDGETITATYGSGLTVSQLFDTDSNHTLDLLIAKLKADTRVKAYATILYGKRLVDDAITFVTTNDTAMNLVFTSDGVQTVDVTTSSTILNADDAVIFGFTPKYAGAKYNDVTVLITPNSRGTYYFDVTITLLNSDLPVEVFRALRATTSGTSGYLDKITRESQIVNPIYVTDTLVATDITPKETFLKFEGGVNGDTITEADIIGDSVEKTGVYAFDGFDDISRIACFIDTEVNGLDDSLVEPGLATYAATRKDITHFALIHGVTTTQLVEKRAAWGIDSNYSRIYADGLGLIVPNSDHLNDVTYQHSLGDIIGAAAYSAANYKPWLSFAGENRGQIINNIGVGNQWGANQLEMDYLAQNQINLVIARNKKRVIWGNFTAQMDEDLLSYNSIRDLMIYMKKALIPLAGIFLEEPNDFPTWKAIYAKVKPWILNLEDTRAIFEGRWYGDQDATSLDDLIINNKADVQLGKYKAKFLFKPINSLQEFGIDLVLTDSSVSFEEIIPISNLNN